VFFPTLEQYGITTVIHMGDAFDSRKSIDYQSLEWSKRVVFEPLSKYDVHMIVGNHDSYYKNTNNTNSPQLLLKDYPNVKTYSSPTEIKVDNLNILLLPWICMENEEQSLKMIQKTKAKVAMGHLELQGFRVNRSIVMEHGLEANLFKNFSKVFSGHYHTRSDNGTVFYTGNPYEIYWTDVNDTRGFTIFDTETLEHTPINNPYKMFYNIYYEDTDYQTFDTREYENKIVKVIVRKKTNTKKFEKFIDKLYNSNIAELKVIENFDIQEPQDFEAFESEDTLSILNRYVEEAEVNLDKSIIQRLLQEVYQEACELV
jgi:DNA repair exonuclease SbcCD nuclease subunit